MTIPLTRPAGIAICAALVLGACDDDGQAPAGADRPAASTTPTTTTVSPATVQSSTSPPQATVPPTTAEPLVAIVSVDEHLAFYPACGNETLEHEAVTWYPVTALEFHDANDEFMRRVAELKEAPRERSPVVGTNGFARTVPAGPGDDIGTLVVWADGVARWVSDSGKLDVWMIDDELTYNWVC